MITLLNKQLINIQQNEDTSNITFNLDKEYLASMPMVMANPLFSDKSGWELVSIVYKKSTSNKRFTPSFRGTRSSSNSKLKSGMNGGDVLQLIKIIISKKSRAGNLVIKRSQMDQADFYDFQLNTGAVVENVAPPAPSNLLASLDGYAPSLSFGSSLGATSYKIYRGESSSNLMIIASSSTNSYKDTTAAKGQTYCYSVKATNGLDSNFSGNSFVTTPVVPPSSIAKNSNPDGLPSISWGSVAGATSYKISKGLSPESLSEVDVVTEPTYKDTNASIGQTYYYAVKSYNGSNSPVTSSVIQATCIPSTPSNFLGSLISGVPSLSWDSISGFLYKVFRSNSSSQSGQEIATDIDDNNYTDSSAVAGNTYHYSIVSYKNGLDSLASDKSALLPILLQPANLNVSILNTKPSLNWGDVSGATSYKVYRGSSENDLALIATSTLSEYNDASAPTGTSFYKVVASNGISESGPSSISETLVPPSKPSLLSPVTTISSSLISWGAVDGATSYTILKGTSINGMTVLASGVLENSYLDTSVSSGGDYYYSVKASNGEESEASDASLINIPLIAPTISANSSLGQVSVNWASVQGSFSYKVYRGTSPQTLSLVASVSDNFYIDTGVVSGTTYHYGVKSVDEVDSEMSSTASATVPVNAPDTISASSSADKISLSWGSVAGADSYKVYRGTSSGSLTLLASSVLGSNYEDSSVEFNTRYYYAVKSYNNAESNLSPEASSLSAPQAPQNLSVVISSNKPSLSWESVAGVIGNSAYRIFRGTSPSSLSEVSNSSSNEMFDGSALDGTTYYYGIKSYNGTYSSMSAVSEIIIPARTISNLAIAEGSMVTGPLGNLIPTINLSWTPLNGASYTYKVYRGTSESSINELCDTTGYNASSVNVAIPYGSRYYYAVAPVQNSVESAKSNVVSYVFLENVTSLSVAQVNNSINVSWEAVSGATSYEVRRVVGNSSRVIATVSGASYSDTIKSSLVDLTYSDVTLPTVFQTPTPYPAYTQTYTQSYSFPDAIAVYFPFDVFSTENLWDTFTLYDSANKSIYSQSGVLSSGSKTSTAYDNNVTLKFTSDIDNGVLGPYLGITITTAKVSYDLLDSTSQNVYYYVTAKNDSFESSEVSTSMTTVKKPVVTSVLDTASSKKLKFSSVGQTEFDISYGTSSLDYTTTLLNETSPKLLSSLTEGVTHYAKVKAKNSYGSILSEEVEFTPSATFASTTTLNGPMDVTNTSFSAAHFRGLAYGNGMIIAITNQSGSSVRYIISYDSGATWVTKEVTPVGSIQNIVFSNGKFWVFSSTGGSVASSTDGINWTASNYVNSSTMYSLAYSSGTYVSVGTGGRISTSTDEGINWTGRSGFGITATLTSVAANGSTVVAASATSSTTPLYVSTNSGTTWVACTALAAAAGISDVIFVAGTINKFIAVGTGGKIFSSSNGLAWTSVVSPTTGLFNGIIQTSSPLNLVAFGNGTSSPNTGRVCYSSNGGVSWTAVTNAATGLAYYKKMVYTGSKHVAFTDVFNSMILITSSVTTWPASMANAAPRYTLYTAHGINSVCKNPSGVIVTVGYLGCIARSNDNGATWTYPALPSTTELLSVATSGTTFVAVGLAGNVLYSTDSGVTFTKATGGVLPANTETINDVTYGNGKFVMVTNTSIYTSSDGQTWAKNSLVPAGNLSTVYYSETIEGSKVYIAGGVNSIYTSTDGAVTWTNTKPTAYGVNMKSIAYGSGYFVGVTTSTFFMYSKDGINWTNRTSMFACTSIAHCRGSFFMYNGSSSLYVIDNPKSGEISVAYNPYLSSYTSKPKAMMTNSDKVWIVNQSGTATAANGGQGITAITTY